MLSGQPFRAARERVVDRRLIAAILATLAALSTAVCGGSTSVTSIVGPDGVRCQTSVSATPTTVAADGGTVTVSVTAARDCEWTAATDASWVQLSSTSGQGNGSFTASVAPNELSSTRSGVVAVNDQRLTISQQARPCSFNLHGAPERIAASGGRASFSVDTLAGCAWTATSSAGWLRVLTASGTGSGTVEFEAAPNDGASRQGAITVGDRSISINQAGDAGPAPGPAPPGCPATLTPSTVSSPFTGGAHTLTLNLPGSCEWTASSSATWASIAPVSGRGTSSIVVTVARNGGSARSATISAAGVTSTISQAAAPTCTVTINPVSQNFSAAGGEGTVRVTTQEGCEWTASGGAAWTTIVNARGTSSGDMRYSVRANASTAPRSTTFSVGGRTHSVTQEGAAPTCSYTISAAAQAFTGNGGEGRVTVTTQPGCSWSVSGGAAWVTVVSGGGSGSGEVVYSVQANGTNAPRSATLTIAGHAHAIAQDAGAAPPPPSCTYTLQPGSASFGASGGEGRFDVVTEEGCSWSASSGAAWLTVSSGSGTGRGQVVYTVQNNAVTSPRSTTVVVNGQAHTVSQEAAAPTCSYALQPPSASFGSGGGNGQVEVVTEAGCSWSASSGASWVTVNTANGTGRGPVSYSVQANGATASRSTTLTVNGQTHTISQDAAAAPTCSYALQPPSASFSSSGGGGQFEVVTEAGCNWSAASGASWVTVNTAAGTGRGPVGYSVQANAATSPRSTSITVNGQSHTVSQDAAPCTYTLEPPSREFSDAGGQGTVRVNTGAACTWNASSSAAWITLSSSGGTGTTDLQYTVAPNDGGDREGTITIAGRTHRVTQRDD